MKVLSLKEKKLEWNILILVILVMLTAAMMWLLTMSFLKQMFTYTVNLDWYYNSYYLSKAWIELALTEIDNSDIWFSNEITWDDNIFTQNLCNGLECSVTLKILGRSKNLNNLFWQESDCTSGNAFTLSWWESFALPLFLQSMWISNVDIILWSWGISYITNNIGNTLNVTRPDNISSNRKLTLSLVFPNLDDQLDYLYIATEDFDDSIIDTFIWSALGTTNLGDEKLYLMISNPEETPVSFCFSSQVDLPATKFYVVSLWNFQWKYVGMQAIYAQPIPSFMFDWYHWAAKNLWLDLLNPVD